LQSYGEKKREKSDLLSDAPELLPSPLANAVSLHSTAREPFPVPQSCRCISG